MQDFIREISFRELFYYLLSKWKIFVVALVCSSLLVGLYCGFKAYNDYTKSKEVIDNSDFIANNDLDEEEKYLVEEIIQEYRELDDYIEKVEDDYLYQMDAYSVYRLQTKYYLNTGYVYNYMDDIHKDYSNELIDAYRLFAVDDTVKQRIVESKMDNVDFSDLNYMISSSTYGMVVSFYYRGKTEEDCRLMSDIVDSYLSENYNMLVNTIGKHEFTFINGAVSVLYDENIENAKETYSKHLTNLRNDINSKYNALSNQAKKIVEACNNSISENDKGEIKFVTLFKPYVKILIIVPVFAVFVIAFCFIIVISLSGKVVNINDMMYALNKENCYMISTFDNTKLHKKQMESGGTVYSIKTIEDVLAINIKNSDKAEIVILSDTHTNALAEELCVKMKECDINCSVVSSDENVANNITDRNVILLCEYAKSRMSDVRSEVMICKMLNANIIVGLLAC